MTQLFETINHVPLDNSFVTNLNQQLDNINGNFRKLLSLPLVKGDKGDGVGVLELDTCVEMDGYHYFTTLGRAIVVEIYRIYSEINRARILAAIDPDVDGSVLDGFVTLGNIPRGTLEALKVVLEAIEINTQNFEAISIGNEFDVNPDNTYPNTPNTTPNTSNDLISYNNNLESNLSRVKIYYQRTSEEVTQQETTTYFNGVSVGYVFHFDGRLHDIRNYDNELAVNFIDTSCALMITNATGHIDIDINNNMEETFTIDPDNVTVTRCSIIPTLYFDGDDTQSHAHTNTFCWMINDRRTGITAQGLKGDAGDSTFAYICEGELDGYHTTITIEHVLSPQDIQVNDIPNGSIAFVWFQHNDGIPTDEDIDYQDIDYPVSVINQDTQEIQIGTERYRALDLAVGVVYNNGGVPPYIDYNMDYGQSVYLSLANIFQSCILYNEMLRLNKYPYVARGLFVPDNTVDYNTTYTQSNEPAYHLFGSFGPTTSYLYTPIKTSYIGVAPISQILKGDSINPNYWDVYQKYNTMISTIQDTRADMGTLKSLYSKFIMHNFKIETSTTRSALTIQDDDTSQHHLLQTSVTLGPDNYTGFAYSSSNVQAAITMYTNNQQVSNNGTHGIHNYVPNWWGTPNVARLYIYHGDIGIYSDPYAPENFAQNFEIRNPYIKFLAETERYLDTGTIQGQTFCIAGYGMDMINIPDIHIHGKTPNMTQPWNYPFATHRAEPRITIDGNVNDLLNNDSSFIHINQMKSVFDITGLGENPQYTYPFEIKRTDDYTVPAANMVPGYPNQDFHNFEHYKLGLRCTNTSVSIHGDTNYSNYTILQVNNGAVRFDNNLYVGQATAPADEIQMRGSLIRLQAATQSDQANIVITPSQANIDSTNNINILAGGILNINGEDGIYIGMYQSSLISVGSSNCNELQLKSNSNLEIESNTIELTATGVSHKIIIDGNKIALGTGTTITPGINDIITNIYIQCPGVTYRIKLEQDLQPGSDGYIVKAIPVQP